MFKLPANKIILQNHVVDVSTPHWNIFLLAHGEKEFSIRLRGSNPLFEESPSDTVWGPKKGSPKWRDQP